MRLQRRRVLKNLCMMWPTLSVMSLVHQAEGRDIQKYMSLEELLSAYPQDLVHSRSVIGQEPEAHKRLLDLGVLNTLSSQGLKLEFSSHVQTQESLLQKKFGLSYERIHPLAAHHLACGGTVDIQDSKCEIQQKVVFVWNHICSWQGSPRTRLAVLNWAKENLTAGGIYIDEKLRHIPSNADYSGLEVLHKDSQLTVFRKT